MNANLHSSAAAPSPNPWFWSRGGSLQPQSAGRPQRIALLNLMPDKPTTERHFAQAFTAALRPIEWVLTLPEGYRPATTPRSYLERFYTPWSALDLSEIDGLIVTGAPLERLPYEEVRYWNGLVRVFEDAREHAIPCLAICWAAQAALYHFHGVEKRILPEKCFGVFEQQVLRLDHPLLAGLAPRFYTPVSRHSEIRQQDLPNSRGLEILAASPDSGLCLVAEPAAKSLYMFNHLEYDAETLPREYARDRAAGLATAAPRNTEPRRLPHSAPVNLWAESTRLFFAHWADGLEIKRENTENSTIKR